MKHNVKALTSLILSAALIIPNVTGSILPVMASEKSITNISTGIGNDDGISVENADSKVTIQTVESKVKASVTMKDDGIRMENTDMTAGEYVPLQVKASNKQDADTFLKVYFWDYDGKVPEEKNKWKELFTEPCMDVIIRDLDESMSIPVQVKQADGTETKGKAAFVQEEEEKKDTILSRYVLVDIPAGAEVSFDMAVTSKAGTMTVVPTVAENDIEVYFDAVPLTWNTEDISIGENSIDIESTEDSIKIENSAAITIAPGKEDTVIEIEGETSELEKSDTETESENQAPDTEKSDAETKQDTPAVDNAEPDTNVEEANDTPGTGEHDIVISDEDEDAETKEHFTEVSGDFSHLNSSHFASSRLVVLANSSDDIIDPEHVIGSYGDVYLLQYDSAEQAMAAYEYYEEHAEAVEPDAVVETASEVLSDDNIEMNITEEQNPVATLAVEEDSTVAQNTDSVIALIDTGASQGPNVIDRVSLIDDVLEGNNGHANDMVASIVSQNPDARILSIRALGDDGYGSISAVVSAIEYAINSHVDIINLSMYSKKTLSTSVLEAEILKAIKAGITVVGSAGNDGADVEDYVPGSLSGVWTIGSVNEEGVRLKTSNYGDKVDYYVVSTSTSVAAAKFTGYISVHGLDAADTDTTGLIFTEATEDNYTNDDIFIKDENPDTTKEDDTIYDPIIEKYVKEHADTSYVGEGSLKLVNVMDVDTTIASEDDLRPDETIDTLMTESNELRFLTQQTGRVPVYQFDENSEYLVAYADLMHNDKRARVVDSLLGQNNTYGITYDNYHFDTETGLVYIPKDLYVAENGTYYFQYLQMQILYGISDFNIEKQWNSAAYSITEESDGDVSSVVSGDDIFMQVMTVQVGKYMDVESMLVSVNGLPIEGELYAYDTETGLLTIGFSSAAVQSVWVQAEKSADAPEVEPGMKAAWGADRVNGIPSGCTYAQMNAVSGTTVEAAFDKVKAGYGIKSPAKVIYPEGSSNFSGANAGGTVVYAYRGAHDYGSNSSQIIDYILSKTGDPVGMLQGGKVYNAPNDAIYPFAVKLSTIDDANIAFEDLDYNLHLVMECCHTNKGALGDFYTSAWRTANVALRCVASDTKATKPWAAFAIYTARGYATGQNGIGFFKVLLKPTTGGVKVTKRLTNPTMSTQSDRIWINTTFGIYTDKKCTKLYKNDSFNGTLSLKADVSEYKVSKTVMGMKPGIYYIKETGRCPGTIQNQNVYSFTVTSSATPTSKFKNITTGEESTYIPNSPFRGKFKILKKEKGTETPLAGAVFRVSYYSKDRTSKTQKADATWYFKSGDGKNGTKLGEVVYDEAYYLASWKSPDSGKTFKSSAPIQLTNGDWYLPLSYLYVTEMYAPKGYERDKTEHKITITTDKDSQSDNGVWVKATCPIRTLTVYNTGEDFEAWKVRVNAKKVDAGLKGLEGAEFEIYDNEECTGDRLGLITSGKDGMTDIATIDKIPDTQDSITLYCKELTAPNGYTPTDEIFSLTFKKAEYDKLLAAGDDTGELKTFGPKDGIVNEEGWTVRVNAKKVNENLGPLAGAEFGVFKDTALKDRVGTITSGADGMTDILSVGVPMNQDAITLYCQEKTAPDGYTLSNRIYNIEFTKAEYDKLVAAGNTEGELKTFGPADGIVNIKGKEPPKPTPTPPPGPEGAGVYVKKTSTAADEILDLDSYSLGGAVFSVTGDGFSGTLTTYDNGISNTVSLPDKSWYEYPSPVYDKDGNYMYTPDPILHTVTTTYYVKEVTAPKGHKMNLATKSFTVTMPYDKDKTIPIEFEDEPIFCKNKLDVEKLGVKGNPIQGAVFKAEYFDAASADESKLVKTWYLESDANGKIYMDESHLSSRLGFTSDSFFMHKGQIVIPIGGYLQLTEVAAPAEYVIDDRPFNFATSETVQLTNRFYNDLQPCRIRLKKCDMDGTTPLAGVEFEIKFLEESIRPTANMKPTFQRLLKVGETLVRSTNDKGEVSFDNLDQGKYQITEIKTSPGHTLLKEPIIVTLPMQMTDDEANEYGNVDFGSALEDRSYTDKWFFYDCLYEITNTATFVMPMSGGIGGWKYGFIGIAIFAIAGTGLVLSTGRRKKRKPKSKIRRVTRK